MSEKNYKKRFIEELKTTILFIFGFGIVTYFMIIGWFFLNDYYIENFQVVLINGLFIFPFFLASYILGSFLVYPFTYFRKKHRKKIKNE